MEGRRDQFVAEVAAAEGLRDGRAARWSIARSTAGSGTPAGRTRSPRSSGSANPVAAPYFNFTIPEPTGIVGIVAPKRQRCSGSGAVAPPLVAGNTVVLLTSETRPLPAITLTEVLATSDVPGGVVNVLTGFKKELVPVLAGHVDVDGLDVGACPTTCASRPSSWPPTTSSACRAARAGSPMPASTGSTTVPPNAPNGSPSSSR